ncbi:hypothetical protein QCA50_003377 [Cerrena zonata]|uniref:Uncharacterized protein n=1 Tax=Cerrena zonata TaxID=2478898 RepID=A0AAW0GW85_9APHY
MMSKYNQAKRVVNGLALNSSKGEDFTNNFFGALDVSTNKKSKDYTRLSTKKLARDLDEDTFGLFNNVDKREQSRGPRQNYDSDDDEELEGWDEETTLVAMMHDRYVFRNLTICARMK